MELKKWRILVRILCALVTIFSVVGIAVSASSESALYVYFGEVYGALALFVVSITAPIATVYALKRDTVPLITKTAIYNGCLAAALIALGITIASIDDADIEKSSLNYYNNMSDSEKDEYGYNYDKLASEVEKQLHAIAALLVVQAVVLGSAAVTVNSYRKACEEAAELEDIEKQKEAAFKLRAAQRKASAIAADPKALARDAKAAAAIARKMSMTIRSSAANDVQSTIALQHRGSLIAASSFHSTSGVGSVHSLPGAAFSHTDTAKSALHDPQVEAAMSRAGVDAQLLLDLIHAYAAHKTDTASLAVYLTKVMETFNARKGGGHRRSLSAGEVASLIRVKTEGPTPIRIADETPAPAPARGGLLTPLVPHPPTTQRAASVPPESPRQSVILDRAHTTAVDGDNPDVPNQVEEDGTRSTRKHKHHHHHHHHHHSHKQREAADTPDASSLGSRRFLDSQHRRAASLLSDSEGGSPG